MLDPNLLRAQLAQTAERLRATRGLELDVDWLRNGYRVVPDTRAAASLTARWLFVVQQVLGWVGL